ncbi:MAG: patatin-like phospholipase family protein [Chromatiales bacterium]|jgi:NTE family protein|nr:patatin-like phospholipase family protein [Chromatiales bacterium]
MDKTIFSVRPFSRPLTARAALAILCLVSPACAWFGAVDTQLEQWTEAETERIAEQITGDRSPELVVLLAFSGGGTRAAALSYGVLLELADTSILTQSGARSLLNEVDVISSVSGGSFTAAYFGLHGEQSLTDFEERFLRRDVQWKLFRQWFNPLNWFKLLSRTYGRSDLAAEYYDKILFEGATMKDLESPTAPLILINTTDLGGGSRFPLVRDFFGLICVDFDSYPVSRAVAASSAVPVLFPPITLESFAGSCGYQQPQWVANALQDPGLPQRKIEAQRIEEYQDRKQRPWLHLVDGGVSDNLGLRSYYNAISVSDKPGNRLQALRHPNGRHYLIISVNAYAKKEAGWVLERYSPSLFEAARSVSADQIVRYSEDTIQIVRYSFEDWLAEKSTRDRPITFHFVDVSFKHIEDDNERKFLNGIGTSFDLSDEEVDRLIAAARKIMRESTEFNGFLEAVSTPD